VAEPYETEVDIAAPVEEVFRHLVEADAMVTWMGRHARLEPEPGGRFEVDIGGTPVRGQFVEVDAPRRVVVTWGVPGSDVTPVGSTRLEITLTRTPDGTHLRLVHSNLPDVEAHRYAEGWSHFLPRLATVVTGGDPGPDAWEEQA
jgi:uncharacterized protein YndB with AHSA1/START domain